MREKILVPLDGSKVGEAALPYVEDLILKFLPEPKVEVTLMQVLSSLSHYVVAGEASARVPYTEEEIEEMKKQAVSYLENAGENLRKKGATTTTRVEVGHAAEEIIKAADDIDVDIIAMSTHGRSGLARLVMGSGIDKILRVCEQPVLLVRPRDEGGGETAARLSKIIVPLDGSNTAEAALPLAEELARALGLELILIQVIGVETTVRFGSMAPDSWSVPSDVLQQLDVVASGYLTGLAKQLKNKGLTVQWEVFRGAAGSRIVEFAKETSDSLVAMTTHGRSGFRRWVMGSVADEVVRHTGEPVLVIRPHRPR